MVIQALALTDKFEDAQRIRIDLNALTAAGSVASPVIISRGSMGTPIQVLGRCEPPVAQHMQPGARIAPTLPSFSYPPG